MDIIYHYTDLNGLLSIIQNKKLWLSNYRNLNDHQEITWFLKKLENAKDEALKTNPELTELNDLLDNMYSNLKSPLGAPYICSFSSEKDLLSQWRAYADDGQGVAIGFKKEAFKLRTTPPFASFCSEHTTGIYDVIYDENEQNKLIEELISKTIQFAKDGIKSNDLAFIGHCYKANLFVVTFKNPAFTEEKEIRIINNSFISDTNKWGGNLSPAKHRVSGGTITTYFEYDYEKGNGEIYEIVLGPKCHMTEVDLKLFLQSSNVSDIKIKRSSASYR